MKNKLAKMCNKQGTHDRHGWTDGKGVWQCFGGPFTPLQEQIKEQRDQEVVRA